MNVVTNAVSHCEHPVEVVRPLGIPGCVELLSGSYIEDISPTMTTSSASKPPCFRMARKKRGPVLPPSQHLSIPKTPDMAPLIQPYTDRFRLGSNLQIWLRTVHLTIMGTGPVFHEKHILAVIASLRDMVGHTGYYCACKPCHTPEYSLSGG